MATLTLNTTYSTNHGAYIATMQNRHGVETYIIYRYDDITESWLEVCTMLSETKIKYKLYEYLYTNKSC